MLLKQSLIIYVLVMLVSCKQDREHIDVSGIPVDIKADRFEEDLFTASGENTALMKKKYGDVFDLFCFKIVELGTTDTLLLKNRLKDFTTNKDVNEIYQNSEKIFHDFTAYDQALTDAFRHFKYYFPGKLIPHVFTFISGFNYSVVAADSSLGIGLDMYLGADAKYYPSLQLPRYKTARMRKEYLVADGMRGWIQSEWEEDPAQSDLLSRMVYYGKILYCMNALMPDEEDSIITGYSSSQLKWCNANEKNTWSFLIDEKLLFSNDQNQVAKFINDGPSTNGFPKEAPGAIGQWMGWKIVNAYMKNNSSVTLEQLMNSTDGKKILNDSKYKPGK